jgi:protein TonB
MTAGLSALPAAHAGRSCLPYLVAALALHAGVLALPLDWKPAWQATSALSAKLLPPAADPSPAVPATSAPSPVPAPRPAASRSRMAVPVPAAATAGSPQPPAAVAAPAAEPVAATSDAVPVARAPGPLSSPARYDAAYLNNPHPAYPAASRRLGEEGRVLLRVRVGADGRPLAVDLEKGSNFSRLDEAARDAVARWRFVPARRGDEAIEGSVLVPLVFRLDQ